MIKLELEVAQIEVILNVLGQAPYNASAPIIEEIRKQAIPQLPAPEPEAAE